MIDNYGKEVQYIANSIATGVNIALSEENFKGITSSMEYARSDSRFEFATMYQIDTIGHSSSPTVKRTLFKTYPEHTSIDENMASEETLIVKRAFFRSEIMNGEIVVGFHTSEIISNVNNLQRAILVASIVVLVISSILSYFISSTIIGPMRSLRDAALQIGAGHVNPEININTRDEVGDLGNAFNKMACEIEQSRLSIRQKNDELRKTNRELITLNKDKNYIIEMVSHDLKSPMHQIKGLLSLLKMEDKNISDKNIELINKAHNSLNHLFEMIEKILDIEAIEGNKSNLNLETVDLISLLDQTIHHYYMTALDKEIKIQFDFQKECLVIADKSYAIQVFDNLLSNAIKFSPKKSTIHVNIKDNVDYLAVQFIDKGPGICKTEQRKLFKRYQKLSARPTSDEPSSGLGLSIVKKYVDMLGGRVYYKEADISGGIFVVELKKPGTNTPEFQTVESDN